MGEDDEPGSAGRPLPAHIVDSHGHVWSGGKPSPTHRQAPFSYDALSREMSCAGVERMVLITTSWDPRGDDYCLEAVRAYPDRFGLMGLYDIAQPPDPGALKNWTAQPGMLGLRLFLRSPQAREWLLEGSGDWLWPVLERAGIPLMIFAGDMMPKVAEVAATHPGLRISLDSLGVSLKVLGDAAFEDYDEVLALARYPNVTIKVESVPFLSQQPYPYRNMHPVLRRTYDAFGPHRMFWGSDVTLLKTPYRDCVTFMAELDWLSDRDLELIMGRAIGAWIDWPISP